MTGFHERTREDGVAAVEMAIVAPMLVILLIGVLDVGWMMWQRITLQEAVQEGAVYAVFNPVDPDIAIARVLEAGPSELSEDDVRVRCHDDDRVVEVVADYEHHMLVSGLEQPPFVVSVEGDVMAAEDCVESG